MEEDYDLEEAKIKDEILSYCQSKGSSAVTYSDLLYTEIFRGRLEKDRISYFLNLIQQDGYLKIFGTHRGHFQYDFSADKFLREGGYTQVILYNRKIKVELGEKIGSVLEVVISESIDSNIKKDFFSISEDLNRIAKEFEKDENVDWFNIGNSCRKVLITFVNELINKGELLLDEGEKRGDIKHLIGKYVVVKSSGDKFNRTLKSFLNSVWDHCQSLSHRKTSTKEEALRAFIWTTLSINEIVTLIKK